MICIPIWMLALNVRLEIIFAWPKSLLSAWLWWRARPADPAIGVSSQRWQLVDGSPMATEIVPCTKANVSSRAARDLTEERLLMGREVLAAIDTLTYGLTQED